MKLVRFLLFPISILYDFITRIRNYFFDIGFFKSTSFNIPLIAVGNLSVGGTGKTPQIEYLIRLLKDNYRVAVLSRGYKRKTKGFILVDKNHNAADVGDEPLQYFKKFDNISVAVEANRVQGVQKLQELVSPDVILLDDAYQHRKVKAKSYILLTKYDDLFVDDFLLPTGNLRESKKGANRAEIIIITKCPKTLSEAEQQKIANKIQPKSSQRIFFTTIAYANELQGNQKISTNELQEYEVLLITGIANPKPLLTFLDSKKCNYKHLNYPDHYEFKKNDVKQIKDIFENLKSSKKLILTTEKDYVRLGNRLKSLSYLPIQIQFLHNQHKEFNLLINQIIKK